MNKTTSPWIKKLRAAVSLALIALYVVGLVLMFVHQFQTGLILWVISTLGGIGLLYWIHTVEKRNAPADDAGEKPEA